MSQESQPTLTFPATLKEYDFRLGPVIGFKGLKGEVKVKLGCRPGLLKGVKTACLLQAPKPTAKGEVAVEKLLTIAGVNADNNGVHLRFKELPDRNSVESLLGAIIFLKKNELAPLDEDEWFLDQLVGLDVFTTSGTAVGKVTAIYAQATTLLAIEKDGKEHLVPFVKALVPLVDIKGNRLEVSDLPGLFD
jgi:16S rRNA processing protein RimM